MHVWRIRDWVYVLPVWGCMGVMRPGSEGIEWQGLWLVGNPLGLRGSESERDLEGTVDQNVETIRQNEIAWIERRKKT